MARFDQIQRRGPAVLLIVGALVLLARVAGVSSPWFAVPAAFVLLGLIDLLRPFLVLRIPDVVFRLREWERRGSGYHALGAVAFGRMLRWSPLRYLNTRVYLAAKSGDLEQVHSEVVRAEAAHFWAGGATLPYLAMAWAQEWWSSLAALLVFHLAVNLLPILHLRWTRVRLGRVLARRRWRGLSGIRPAP